MKKSAALYNSSMKKLVLICSLLLVFGGCRFFSGENSADTTQEENETVTAQGEIAENSGGENSAAMPFLLENESGRTLFFLESAYEDLARYVDQGTVEVKGEKEELKGSPIALLH